ncbi:FMN-dependent NADH-azoreductase [Bacillus salitolerans]|uniref:FMN dependent NADH:quinone oxidoreductase n=1 Tax=Bacillus salitolerans TaxID=1437434 RepID=A0ABW4LLP9_9BACI
MSTLLYIIAHPLNENLSVSQKIGKEFLKSYKDISPDDDVIELNLFDEYVPDIDKDVLEGWEKLNAGVDFSVLSESQRSKIARINELTSQFIEADKYVFITPLWNLSIPAKLKAYIDTIVIAGKTFKYTENGPQGLLSGKKAIHIHARGGIFSEGPMKELEFGDRYLKSILGFIGMEVETIVAEGHAFVPEEAENIINDAINKAKSLAKSYSREKNIV